MDSDQLQRRREGVQDDSASVQDSTDDALQPLLAEAARISGFALAGQHTAFVVGSALVNGRLQVGRRIGQGGMGVVYEAFDSERRSMVALKTLTSLDGAGIYRLKQEFRILAQVSHHNLVRLHELFAMDGQWFFTMELIDGERFDQWVRPGDVLDEQRLRTAFNQVLRAVAAIHKAGKLHRDLKPSNVLVTPQGRVVVLDFGLATDPREVFGHTVSRGALSGTPAFMAPEQAAGNDATSATDLYALGVILFEALTGKLPFEGSAGHVLAAKQNRAPPHVRALFAEAPSDLSALADALLQQEPDRRPSLEALAEALQVQLSEPHEPPPSLPPPAGITLFGRASELRALRDAYDHTLHSAPVIAFVSGESGIGKSALIDAFLAELRAETNAVVLQGRCYERELVPFKAFDLLVDDLSRHLRRIGHTLALELMPREVYALARLFPVLDRVETVAQAPRKDVLDPQELRRRAFTAFAELLARMRDRAPLVVYIDDLQWLDADSAVLLRYLLDTPEPCPLLFVTSHRTEALAANQLLNDVLHAARRNPQVAIRELHLGPLTADAAQELAQRMLGEGAPALAARIAVEAQGSPFFLMELARRAPRSGKTSLTLQEALHERIEQLEPAAQRLLQVVAIAGRPLAEALAVQAAGADHVAVDQLCKEQLLRHRPGAAERVLECYHDRIREIVGTALSSQTIVEIHRSLMEALLRQHAADPEQLAIHCEGAGERALAASYATAAADAAHGALAFDRAAALYRMALTCALPGGQELVPLWIKLGSALSDGGRGAEAAPLLIDAADHVDATYALELRRRAAEQWLVSGYIQKGLAAYQQVLGAVGLRLPNSPRAALLDLVWFRVLLWLRGLRFRERDEDAIPRAQLLRIDACKTAWSLSFVSTIRASAFQARHLFYALAAGEPNRVALGYGMEAVYQSLSGRRSQVRVAALQRAARRLVGKLDNPHAETFVDLAEGQCSYMLGRWTAACDALSRAEATLVRRCRNVSWELNSTRFFWGNALVFRGRWREIGARLETWLNDAQWRGDLYAGAALQVLRARSLTLAQGNGTVVRHEVEDAMERWNVPEFGVQQFLALICLVQSDLFEGNAAGAHRTVSELWPLYSSSLMSRIQVCRVSAHQHAASAALAMASEQPGDRQWIRKALGHARVLRREKAEWASAFAHSIEATAEHLRGRHDHAIAGLETAVKAFESVDMLCYAAAVRRQLGSLQGGDSGRSLVAVADTFYRQEGVVAPAKLARMMAPGFGV